MRTTVLFLTQLFLGSMLMPFCIVDAFVHVMQDRLPNDLINLVVTIACELYAAEHKRGPIHPALYNNPRLQGDHLTPPEQRWTNMTNVVLWFAGLDRWNEVYYCRRSALCNWWWFIKYSRTPPHLRATARNRLHAELRTWRFLTMPMR